MEDGSIPRRVKAVEPPPYQLERLRFFQRVFRSIGLGVLISDPRGQITHANPAAERLFGWEPGELVGKSIEVVLAPGLALLPLDQLLTSSSPWVGPRQYQRKRGAVFPAQVTISRVLNEFDEPVALMTVVADGTNVRRYQARLASLSALGAALNAETDVKMLVARICREARALFNVDGVYVTRYDEQTQELVGMGGDGPSTAYQAVLRVALNSPGTVVARAVIERRPVIQSFPRPEDHPVQWRPFRTRSILATPLLRGERVLGTLAFIDIERLDRFGPDDFELAGAFAELAAVALENARLHAAERAKNERLRTLAHVNQLLTASLDTEQVFEAIAVGAQRLLGAAEVYTRLLMTPEGPFELAHCSTLSTITPLRELPFHGTRLGEVVLTQQAWQSRDIEHEHSNYGWAGARERGLHSCLMVPMSVFGRPLGVITVLSREVRTFDDQDVELMRAFAGQAAVAVQNALTLARERQVSRLDQLVQRARLLPPTDRALVEQLLAAAGRFLELGAGDDPTLGRNGLPDRVTDR